MITSRSSTCVLGELTNNTEARARNRGRNQGIFLRHGSLRCALLPSKYALITAATDNRQLVRIQVRYWLVRPLVRRILAPCLVMKYTNERDCRGTLDSTANFLSPCEQPASTAVPSVRQLRQNAKTSPFTRVPPQPAKRVIGPACVVAPSVRREHRRGAVRQRPSGAGCG